MLLSSLRSLFSDFRINKVNPPKCAATEGAKIRAGNTLTVEQHMKTMMKVPMTPPIPTNQVILRKRITPKMFWMHGR